MPGRVVKDHSKAKLGTSGPFKESSKALSNHINNPGYVNASTIKAENIAVSENRGYSFIYEYLSPSEQHLGASKEKRKEMITSLLMNRTMYKLVFAVYPSQFDKSMPIMEDVMILWSIQSGHQNQNQYEILKGAATSQYCKWD
jgi:hypothetical protein